MKKICVCGGIKETRKIFNAINSHIQLCPLKYSKENFEIAIFNKEKSYIMPKCKSIVVNTDLYPSFICQNDILTVTAGFNRCASVTFSSVDGEKFMICICKGIFTLSGKYLCEQEFPVNTNINNPDILITSIAAALICDINIADIENIFVIGEKKCKIFL